jgi:pimeloyl-ACP methyl ester carboxylesterase
LGSAAIRRHRACTTSGSAQRDPLACSDWRCRSRWLAIADTRRSSRAGLPLRSTDTLARAETQASGREFVPFQVANQTELYYEVRGDGPPLLLIMGASGCSGVFGQFAEVLADEFTVVTYDRRGNARSPRRADWNATSPEEQADDAAALLAGLGLAPAAIFGTSSAGIFALAAVIRRPESVRGAVLHEPALFRLFDNPTDVRATLTQLIKEAMEAGGPAAALERFIRFAAGDANWERLDSGIQQAMLTSANTYFGVESGAFDSYLPNEETLASIRTPIKLLVSAQSHPFFSEAAGRLAELLAVEVTRTPGTHFPYLDHPHELVQTIKPFLRSVST